MYIDDIIVTGDDDVEQQGLKERLVREFEIKNLGSLEYFLKIKMAYSKEGIFFLRGRMS